MTAEDADDEIKLIFQASSEDELERSLEKAQRVSRENFGKRIRFYAPSFMYYRSSHYSSSVNDFPTISITGRSCSLKCKHCGGVVLNAMYPATEPQQLFDLCRCLKQKGASGCLISGGCLPDGSVPLNRFVDAIAQIKHELELTVFVHTGIIDFSTAKALKAAGVDAALIDVIGSDETIREIYKTHATVEGYADSLKTLYDAKMAFVPHVVVGLHYGKLKGELNALMMIARTPPSALVVIAFMPIRETEMAGVRPPKPFDIAKTVAEARLMFPTTPLVLGCMRPKGIHRAKTDVLAIRAGVNAVAFPSEEAIRFAETHGYEIAFSSRCCAQIYRDATTNEF